MGKKTRHMVGPPVEGGGDLVSVSTVPRQCVEMHAEGGMFFMDTVLHGIQPLMLSSIYIYLYLVLYNSRKRIWTEVPLLHNVRRNTCCTCT